MPPKLNPVLSRQVFTVSELNTCVRSLMDDTFPQVWVRGEISNFKAYPSGHFYFTLKDDKAQLSAVMFKGNNRALKFRPADGIRVVARGSLTIYEVQGRYQMVVEHLEPDGLGALQLAFEQLKKKLAEEGLFAEASKKKLPFLPRRVGVITSESGAVIHDIQTVIRRRFPNMDIVFYPVKVQGDGAAAEIVAALEYFSSSRNVDVLIVGRGGGSLEDLWAFNEESVARAIFACPIPVISAVGHEVDFTIADFVADVRAATPSAAAELAVPDKRELAQKLSGFWGQMSRGFRSDIRHKRHHVLQLRRLIPHPRHLWDREQLKLMDFEQRLTSLMSRQLGQRGFELKTCRLRIQDPRQRLALCRQGIIAGVRALHYGLERWIGSRRHQLSEACLRLELLSPQHVLRRGYAVVRKPDGRVVTRCSPLAAGDEVKLLFQDGMAGARILNLDKQGGSYDSEKKR